MGVKDSELRRTDEVGKTRFQGNCSAITERVLAAAFAVHARLGPGLLESTYRACLSHRLRSQGMEVECEVPVGIEWDGIRIDTAYRADLIVERRVLLELKATEHLSSIHCAQARTYLKHSSAQIALLINFNVKSLVDGIRRFQR
jgi:GxxExxY protein